MTQSCLGRKHAIETTEMLDFLKEIVETVPDPSAGGTIDLDNENTEGAGGKKRRGKGKKADASSGAAPTKRRRKKKAEAGGDVAEGDAEMRSELETEHDGDASMHENNGVGYRPQSPSEEMDMSTDRSFMPRR